MKPKKIHLVDHYQNAAYRDDPDRIALPGYAPDRLSGTYQIDSGSWPNVAPIIVESSRFQTAWFPDANVAILSESEIVWDALRFAALKSRAASTVFTEVVHSELQKWLESPFHHESRARAIRDSLALNTWACKFGLDDCSSYANAILGYVRLLGLRRYLALPCPDGRTLVDTNPAQKSETMNAIGNQLGPRAHGLAKKGRVDFEQHNHVNVNDELHCLIAICHSLVTGRESVVLTTDEDFLEIFKKAQWFIDTHYRAFLAAKMISAGEYGEPAGILEDTHGYFKGPLTLYRRHTKQLREVLPAIHRSVPVSVIYLAPDAKIHKNGFIFEREMLDMLEVRSRTFGRCTALLGEQNIHVDLGPLKPRFDGLYLGVGIDAGDWLETNGVKTFRSRLDSEHAVSCVERSVIRKGS